MNQSSISSIAGLTADAPEALLQALMVAYDSSEASETALRYAIELAQNFHSFVTVVYVQSPAEFGVEMESGFSQMRESHMQRVCDLQSVADRLSGLGIRNCVLERAGVVADVLAQLVAESRSNLLLLGAHGHRRMDRPRLGSTAEYMLRSMPSAVLTVGPRAVTEAVHRKHGHRPMRVLLYASSLPGRTGRANRFVQTLADKYGSHVEILHVIDHQSKVRDMRTHAELKSTEEALAEHLHQSGVDVTWKLSHGVQGEQIVQRSQEIEADLILFGVEHSTVDPDAMGTISAVIQQAPCPVLTVPGPA